MICELRKHLYKRFKVNYYTGSIVNRSSGRVLTGVDSYGYIQVYCGTFKGKKKMMKGHQVIFLLYHGCLPEHSIDHKNRIRIDNAISNLRSATQVLQSRNKGQSGIVYRASTKRYRARIRPLIGKQQEKTFKTYEEAVSWRKKKEKELWY